MGEIATRFIFGAACPVGFICSNEGNAGEKQDPQLWRTISLLPCTVSSPSNPEQIWLHQACARHLGRMHTTR